MSSKDNTNCTCCDEYELVPFFNTRVNHPILLAEAPDDLSELTLMVSMNFKQPAETIKTIYLADSFDNDGDDVEPKWSK